MKKILLLANPTAGRGRGLNILDPVCERLKDWGLAADIHLSRQAGDIEQHLRESDLASYQAVVITGGDGSLHEAVNGLYSCVTNHPPLGLIPAGTGNAFARELGLLAADWRKAVDIIANGQTRMIDLGRYQYQQRQRVFVNILSLGFAVDAGQTATHLKWLGSSAYTLATLWQTLFLRSWPLLIRLDGKLLEQDCVLVSVANSRYTGTDFLIAPEAKPDDGKLDIIILGKISRPRVLRLFPSIYSGSHIRYPEVRQFRAREIEILTTHGKGLSPDGEFEGKTPVSIECLPGHLQFFWPESG